MLGVKLSHCQALLLRVFCFTFVLVSSLVLINYIHYHVYKIIMESNFANFIRIKEKEIQYCNDF